MTEYSWASSAYNTGFVDDDEAERLITDGFLRGDHGLIGTPADAPLVFADSSGMQVKFRADVPGMVGGQRWFTDAVLAKAVTANGGGSDRVDLAVLRLDRATHLVRAAVVVGAGPTVPAPTQDPYGSGVYELPVAAITVHPGDVTISPTQVTPLAWYLGSGVILCTPTTRPPHRFGRKIKEYPSGNELTSDGANWIGTAAQDTGWVAAPFNAGWGAGGDAAIRKLNGVVFLKGSWKRTGGAVPANTLTGVATLAAAYRPSISMSYLAYLGGGRVGMGHIGTNGAVSMEFFIQAIATNDFMTVGSLSWPAAS